MERGTKHPWNETSGNETTKERNVQRTNRPMLFGNETSWEQ